MMPWLKVICISDIVSSIELIKFIFFRIYNTCLFSVSFFHTQQHNSELLSLQFVLKTILVLCFYDNMISMELNLP